MVWVSKGKMVFVDDGGQAALLIGTAGRGGRAEAAVTLGLLRECRRAEERERRVVFTEAEKQRTTPGREISGAQWGMALQWSHQA